MKLPLCYTLDIISQLIQEDIICIVFFLSFFTRASYCKIDYYYINYKFLMYDSNRTTYQII